MNSQTLNEYVAAPRDGNWAARLAELSQGPSLGLPRRTPAIPDELELEGWVRGLSTYSRLVVVKAAVAAAEPTLTVWSSGAEWRPPVVRDVLDAVSQGSIPHPQAAIQVARAWIASEGKEPAAPGPGTDPTLVPELWEPEFDYLRDEATAWAIRSAEACAASVNAPNPAPFAAAAASAALNAVRVGYVDQSVAPLARVCAWISRALVSSE